MPKRTYMIFTEWRRGNVHVFDATGMEIQAETADEAVETAVRRGASQGFGRRSDYVGVVAKPKSTRP